MSKKVKRWTYDDPKVVYKLRTKKFQSQREIWQNQFFLLKDESNIEENSEISESDHTLTSLRFETNYELLGELEIINILTEESEPETEHIQSSIITALSDKLILYRRNPIETTYLDL